MAPEPIETHLHRSFNWENGGHGPLGGCCDRPDRYGNGLFGQSVRLRLKINLPRARPRTARNPCKPYEAVRDQRRKEESPHVQGERGGRRNPNGDKWRTT